MAIVTWSPRAIKDINEIATHIAKVFNDDEVAILTVHHQSRIAVNNPALKGRLRRRGK